MSFFEQETGVPFPWAKYRQICVNDFVAGRDGEHQRDDR